jgi:xanthine dehydrogenase YagT iron-sulfur-binding subunit
MGVDDPSDRCSKVLYLEGAGAGKGEMTRREFISTVGVVTGGIALGARVNSALATPSADASGKTTAPLELIVNGQKHHLMLDPRVTLLDLLREDLALTGTKKGCDHGQCGACTVLANGRRINSCLALAVSHDGEEITTIEGIARGEDLHPVQSAFIDQDGLQCGYCTPGQICSAVALLAEVQRGEVSFVTTEIMRDGAVELTDSEIRERMSGNICRCGAYPNIVDAIKQARDKMGGGT